MGKDLKNLFRKYLKYKQKQMFCPTNSKEKSCDIDIVSTQTFIMKHLIRKHL